MTKTQRFLFSGLLCATALIGQTLTNDTILKLVKAGMSDDVIIGMVNSQSTNFSVGADDLIALKTAGASDKLIAAMVVKKPGESSSPAAQTPTAAVHEIGVYYKKSGAWIEIEPEVVSFKSGGVLKSMASYGIVKGDMNGHLKGPHSKLAVKTPVEIMIYTPEGVASSEYQLLHLHAQSDSREFRTVTGGVFHNSGGASRDALEFEGKKVMSRTYEVSMPNLKSGEYGLLPPSSGDATGSSGRIGKLYSFQVIE